ncbi:hypothetical protein [Mycolicibacterium fluoranthenivorans]|uniref:Pyruvate/2-oxoglutarate dehydrogenase complex dihydrolipoamide acyltransferase (E2) component n=1 Tax=Mycolicibacterium fluoranthenivorans TaxID=258505 RepID=A0A7X5U5R5_9MYCO|nr:hypothetical protein [Mycolicibacterium fluoranthenivorans]MCV7354491.1 hypothetical protein [Mycolicibacterium fluoranthenivorans]NIH98904.1 pyruvate/2-oxoglutarate dehydrogenase complex dihydrolipoamide acyltransferase (E2) component [Mycolicibacterium fluoranthenivorans]
MAKKIGEFAVYVQDGEGAVHGFLPGQVVPAWAAKQMGDHCFAQEGGEGSADEPVDEPPAPPVDPGDAEDPADPDEEPAGPPPRHGAGSGEPAWRKYAEDNGVDVDGISKRDDIIAAVADAGVPVE